MNKTELIAAVAEKTGLTKKDAERVVSATFETITESLAGRRANQYAWLEWNAQTMTGKFLQRPEREDIPENIKEQLIVELYSK